MVCCLFEFILDRLNIAGVINKCKQYYVPGSGYLHIYFNNVLMGVRLSVIS